MAAGTTATTVELELPAELPITARAGDIEAAIRDHQVVVVAGETGSGKTTQLPKLCLRLGRTSIAHTQPRRIAARSVAERIAAETQTSLGDLIGYQVRFTRKASAQTRVKVMTDGVLLAEIAHDRQLRRYDTIIIDEAHERSLNIDFLLGYLKQLLPRRPELKLIITSATIDTARFAEHFGTDGVPAPVIEVSGRNYPVEVRYRPLTGESADGPESSGDGPDDVDQAGGVARAVTELLTGSDGDILVFCSGEREIRDAAEAIEGLKLARTEVLPLYARLSSAEQHRVFSPHPGRRIVLSTNVAETSLTVPGIRSVIDTGTARISRYSARTKVQRLPIEPISQASANQRAGRCGRLGPGVCIRLFSEEDFLARPEYTEPEILRTSLASVILQMASADLGEIASFPFVEAPDGAQITDGLRLLDELGALKTGSDQPRDGRPRDRDRDRSRSHGPRLTGLGRKLARIPLDPRMGRMLLAGERYGCLAEMMVIVAGLSVQDPRERPAEHQQAADEAHRRFWAPAGAEQERPARAKQAQSAEKRQAKDPGPESNRSTAAATSPGSSADPPEPEGSDFLAVLRLWDYLREQQRELSGNAFRRMCKAEFLHFLRIREWQDLHAQLRQICRDLELKPTTGTAAPGGVHTAILTGLLSQVGLAELKEEKQARGTSRRASGRRARTGPREYQGARGTRFAINPGSSVAKIQPPLVMAAEIVETSRLWARTVAGIDVGQIEEVGAHLLKRSYSEPHWSSRSGSVMAYEQVSLYGIPIVAGRRVGYGRIDPVVAREIFIRSALVEGDWRTRHHFFARNQQLRTEVEGLEDRVRRRDVVVDDQVIFDFYDARVPIGITSAGHFDAWWKTTRHEQPELLDLSEDDLVAGDGSAVRASDFPDHWRVGDLELAVSYRFEPGTEHDGVSVQIPLAVLERLDPAQFSWQLPGFRFELATELIRALPKARRTSFVPAPEFARRALAEIGPRPDPGTDVAPATAVEPFSQVLGRALRQLTGDVVPEAEWRPEAVPSHLQPTFRVVEGATGTERVLAEGTDLAALQRQLLDRSTQSLNVAAGEWTRSGQTRWTFGPLPEQVSLQRAGHLVPAFPHLSDEGESVGLAVATAADRAVGLHRRGLIRLLLLNTPDPTRWVVSHLSNGHKLALGRSPYPGVPALLADARRATVAELLDRCSGELSADNVRDEATFGALCDAVRVDQAELMRAAVDLIAESLLLHAEVSAELGTVRAGSPAAADDLDEQLANLVFDRFASALGYRHLVDLPRYLQAVRIRIAGLRAQPGRDADGLAVITGCEDEYAVLCAAQPPGPLPPDVEAIAWLLEELRVGLFAQTLRTKVPVSAKRVRSAIERARRPAVR